MSTGPYHPPAAAEAVDVRTASRANFRLLDALHEAEAAYAAANPNSLRKWERACRSMPGGNTRTVLFYAPFPLTFARGEGAYLWDLDGHRYTDLLGDYSAGLYGHSHPIIHAAVKRALEGGITLGGSNLYEEQLASLICARFPSIELVRFTNSGTEASLMAMLAARAFTGRPRVLVFGGAYHGGVFYFKGQGSPVNLPLAWLTAPFNDVERTLALIEAHAAELAAIVVEPLQGSAGCIPATAEFLSALRTAATRHGIVLIFDEVMTSRLAPGGLQEALGVVPDMTTLGKYVGGGMSFGAFGGRRDIMSRFDPRQPSAFPHAGTYNNNVLTMAAGVAGLSQVFTPEAAADLNARGDRLRARLNALAAASGVAMQVTGRGSLMNVHFTGEPIPRSEDVERADKTALDLFHLDMLASGHHLARRGFMSLSLPLTDADLGAFEVAVAQFLEDRRPVLAN